MCYWEPDATQVNKNCISDPGISDEDPVPDPEDAHVQHADARGADGDVFGKRLVIGGLGGG